MQKQMKTLISTSNDMLEFIKNNVKMPEVEHLLEQCCTAWGMIIARAEEALSEQEWRDAHPPAPRPEPEPEPAGTLDDMF